MAGRKQAMAKRLAELEERAFQLAVDVTTSRPKIYAARQGAENEDELSACWNEAARAVEMASIAMSILLGWIEERAGLDWLALERQREQNRGLMLSEAAEDNGTGAATGAETWAAER